MQTTLHARRLTCMSSFVSGRPPGPLIRSLAAQAFPDSGPHFCSLSTDGSPARPGLFVVLPEVHPLSFSLPLSLCLPLCVPIPQVCPVGEDRAGRKAFLFLISFLKLPQGWTLQEFAQSPSEAGTHPPKIQLFYPIPYSFRRYLWVIYSVPGAVLTTSAVLWTWSPFLPPPTSSCSCCYSLGQAAVSNFSLSVIPPLSSQS